MADPTQLAPQTQARLEALLGEGGLRTEPSMIESYAHDETESYRFPPAAVALPRTTGEVSRVLAVASEVGLPVTPRGAGTGLSGGALPVRGGLVLSLERMNRIREIDVDDLIAEVEAGVVLGDLQRELRELGLLYPPDPASHDSCQLGGNIAEDSAGPRSCRYGSTRRWVLGLEAVLADGRVIRTGGRSRKDASGYSLTQLLIGSEGTLAVVTAAVLRLVRLPSAALTLALPFAALEQAAAAVTALFRAGHDPAACELLERAALEAVSRLVPIPQQLRDHGALILLELLGDDEEELLRAAAGIDETVRELGAGEMLAAAEAAEQRRLWEIRERVGEAVKQRSAYKEADTVVPRSALARLVAAAHEIAERHGLQAVCYGHAGDGNLHVNLLRGGLREEEWMARRDAAETELFEEVKRLGGTITGEHGIGWTQRRHLELAVGREAMELMRQIKRSFDPAGILNPDKVFPA